MRKLPAVLAAVFAMSASLAAIGAVVISDLAYAEETPAVMEADEYVKAPMVKIAKVEAKPQVVTPEAADMPNVEPLTQKKSKKHAKVNFGQFEGY
ncbi:MAG: hypothetical protein ACO1OB_21360 [Archangium sp.]